MLRSIACVLLISLAASAQAQTAPAEEPPTNAGHDAAAAARSAADAAQAAAEAAKASADALGKALATLERQNEEAAKAAAAEKAKASPEPAAEAAKPSAWTSQLGLSFLSVSGNANALTGKLSGQAEGTFGKWATKLNAGATYGQTQAPSTDESQVTALNVNASAKGQRSISKRFNAYLLAGTLMDRVASIAFQGYGEAGLGLVWFENVEGDFVKSKLSTDLGFRYTRELRSTYYPEFAELPDVEIYSPALKASFRYAISKTAVFTEELEVLPDVVNAANVRATSTSVLSAQIDKGIALSLGFKVRYIGVPAPGAKSTDTELSAGVTWAF